MWLASASFLSVTRMMQMLLYAAEDALNIGALVLLPDTEKTETGGGDASEMFSRNRLKAGRRCHGGTLKF